MPPTSINGTDITGATINGTEVSEITVDGNVVFSSGVSGTSDSLFIASNADGIRKTDLSLNRITSDTGPQADGVDSDGTHIYLASEGIVRKYDTSLNQKRANTIESGSAGSGICVLPDGNLFVIYHSRNNVYKLNSSDLSIIDSFTLSSSLQIYGWPISQPRAYGNGRVVIVQRNSSTVYTVDASGNTITDEQSTNVRQDGLTHAGIDQVNEFIYFFDGSGYIQKYDYNLNFDSENKITADLTNAGNGVTVDVDAGFGYAQGHGGGHMNKFNLSDLSSVDKDTTDRGEGSVSLLLPASTLSNSSTSRLYAFARNNGSYREIDVNNVSNALNAHSDGQQQGICTTEPVAKLEGNPNY